MNPATLAGRSILVTQGKSKSGQMRLLLEERGARVIEIPLIEIQPLDSPQLHKAVEEINGYDWIAFTSANGVRILADKASLAERWPPAPVPDGPRLAVVGPGTEAALQQRGAQADLVAGKHQAEGLLEDLQNQHPEGFEGVRILLPLAALARPLLAEELSKRGAQVEVVAVYDTVPASSNRAQLQRLLKEDPPDIITLASPSAACNLVELCGDPELLRQVNCAAIGPVTARTARQCGLRVAALAQSSSNPGLADAIESFFAQQGQER